MYLIPKEVYEFISDQNKDPITEWRKCKRFGIEYPIYQSEKEILTKISPTIGGEKFELGLPNLCHQARQLRLMCFRNERKLYKRKCSKSGKTIVALYPEDYEGTVFANDIFFGDSRNEFDYGMDLEDGKFLEQLKVLFKKAPMLNMFASKNENSDYTNGSQENKNCYLIFASDYNEDCYYSYSIFDCKDVVDCYGCKRCENLYECSDCVDTNKSYFSQKLENCYNCHFSYGLINCQNCFMCKGLKDKQYYFNNNEVSKEKWDNEIEPWIREQYASDKLKDFESSLDYEIKGTVVKNLNIINSENCIGDLITDSKNVFNTFEAHNAQDVVNVINANGCKDVSGGYVVVDNSEKICEGVSVISNYNSFTVWNSWHNVRDTAYSNFISNVQNVIGCCSMKGKEYCILNKQYSKNEREEKAKTIIKELQNQNKWGEYFDPEFSPFPYNDTVAYEYYPIKTAIYPDGTEEELNQNGIGSVKILNKEKLISDAEINFGGEEIIKTKWRTKEVEINIPDNIQTIKSQDLPKDISQVTDNITEKAIICQESGRPYRIVKAELEFYRKHNLPLPKLHPDIRHNARSSKRPGRNLYLRNCDKTGEKIISVYPQDSKFKVYSQEAYKNEIYG